MTGRMEDGYRILIEKEPGMEARGEIRITGTTAGIAAVCSTIEVMADELGMTVQEVICRVAVILMGDVTE